MSFRQRLVLFLTLTLVGVQVLTAVIAYFYLRDDLLSRTRLELRLAMGAFTRQIEFLSERVADNVQVLSLDYALRTAIAQHDGQTLLSALRNHGRRIGAARMAIIGLDGELAADTEPPVFGRAFSYQGLLRNAEDKGKATGLISADGRLYWVVLVPVRAPITVAFIAAFIPVDDALLGKMQAIAASRQSIVLITKPAGGMWSVAAASGLPRQAVHIPNDLSAGSSLLDNDGREYLAYTAPFDAVAGSAPVLAMLEYPLDDALSSYRAIITPMVGVFFLALLAMLVGTGIIIRGVSRPLEALAAVARRIAVGDYAPPPRLLRKDEIGALSAALTTMTVSIAEREQRLKDAVVVTERAKDEAVRANTAKSQFLSNMSHELRTPLNAILGFSEIIETEAFGPVGVPKYAAYAGDIRAAGGHLLVLVERMLSLAEAEANRLVLKRDAIAGEAPLRLALRALEPFAAQCGVRVEAELACDLPGMTGEAVKLEQAYGAILHNAIRFSPKGGTVFLHAGAADGRVTISIRDSGPGMDEEVLASVTKPFHRLRSAFDGTHQGAGLGLSFAKVVVELHGGSLTLASQPGKGTLVTIALPSADAKREAA